MNCFDCDCFKQLNELDEGYYCCEHGNSLVFGFDMNSLYYNCPLEK